MEKIINVILIEDNKVKELQSEAIYDEQCSGEVLADAYKIFTNLIKKEFPIESYADFIDDEECWENICDDGFFAFQNKSIAIVYSYPRF